MRKRKGKDFFEKAELELLKELKNENTQLENENEKCQELNKELQEEISRLTSKQVAPDINKFRKLFIGPQHVRKHTKKLTIDDPIYGQITIDGDLMPLFFHPLLQRLNFVRQLSFSYIKYPYALHSRFSHSLGVARNALISIKQILDKNKIYPESRKTQGLDFSDEEKKEICLLAEAVGLLHDIGHCPYGHGLDRYIKLRLGEYKNGLDKDIDLDKSLSARYVEKYLSNSLEKCGLNPNKIASILRGDRPPSDFSHIVFDLLDSSFDVDRMDYLVRDAYHTGLKQGIISIDPLIQMIVPFLNETGAVTLAFLETAIPYIEHFLYARDMMYANCYEHEKKLAAELMLVKAVEDFLNRFENISPRDIPLLTDSQLEDIILLNSHSSMPCHALLSDIKKGIVFEQLGSFQLPTLSSNVAVELSMLERDLEKSLSIQNDKKHSYLQRIIEMKNKTTEIEKSLSRNMEMKSLVEMIIEKDLETLYLHRIREWESRLIREAGLKEDELWKLAIYVPPEDTIDPKEVSTRIIIEKEGKIESKRLYDVSPFTKRLFTLFKKKRLRLRIFGSKTLTNLQKSKIRKKSKKLFAEK